MKQLPTLEVQTETVAFQVNPYAGGCTSLSWTYKTTLRWSLVVLTPPTSPPTLHELHTKQKP